MPPSVGGVKQFLVEVFVPRSEADALAAAEQRAREAARRLSENAAEIRYVRATYVPEDETCFHVYEAVSADAVGEAARRAALTFDRVAEAVVEAAETR